MAEVIIPPFALPSADTRHSFLNTQFTALSKMSDEVDADDDDLDHDGGSHLRYVISYSPKNLIILYLLY